MSKVKIKVVPFYVPICIAGSIINGKINYATYGCFGLLSPRPTTYVYIGSVEPHYTNTGIKENGYFSINIPSVGQMQELFLVVILINQQFLNHFSDLLIRHH